MAGRAGICAQCCKQGAGFKRCSVSKQASYCGAACQKAAWKLHRKKCPPPVPIMDVAVRLEAAWTAGDWEGMLQCKGRMEELMSFARSDLDYSLALSRFSNAHLLGFQANGQKENAIACAGLLERLIPILGKLQLFQDQGDEMCKLADILRSLERTIESATWFKRARDVGAAHRFSR